ncbi:MAG: glycosyltransferase family 4 protein [Methanocellales archaeon]|nr:glycosyltransferase family 4 protein [Methanocellales archaeon]
MKVLQATPYFMPHVGGIQTHVLELSRTLVERGHEVVVLTSSVPKSVERERLNGIEVHRFPALNIPYVPLMPFLKKKISSYDADVFHSHCPPPFFSHAFIGTHPHVVTYHCDVQIPQSFMSIRIPKFISSGLEWVHNRFYAAKILRDCDRIITTTDSYAKTSAILKNMDYQVIPNAIRIEHFNEGRAKRDPTVLFVGRITASKGLNYLVHAVPKVLEEIPDVRFMIVGEGEEKENLIQLTKECGVENHVSFMGFIPSESLEEVYQCAGVLVLPSISRLEAFGIVLLEAMACATPVIATRIPGVMDVVDGAGLLVEPANSVSLANAILEILSDQKKAREMGKRGRRLIEENYTWDTVTNQIIDLYEEIR